MGNELQGRKIAFLAASGVEQVELTGAWDAVENAGGTAVLVSPEEGSVQAFDHDVEKADTFATDVVLGAANADEYDALVLPGGTTNPDKLRTVGAAVEFVEAFCRGGKPVAAICHGP